MVEEGISGVGASDAGEATAQVTKPDQECRCGHAGVRVRRAPKKCPRARIIEWHSVRISFVNQNQFFPGGSE